MPASPPVVTPLTDADYHTKTDAVLGGIEACTDRWLDEDVIDIDTQRNGGLLELSFPNRSKIIINTQPPLHEIWLAAKAGGYHFCYRDGAWRDTRDGTEFYALLAREASAQAGQALSFSV